MGTPRPATTVSDISATLNGDVASRLKGETNYWFKYGTSTTYSSRTATGSIDIEDTDAHPVSQSIRGLKAATTYHYSICAQDKPAPHQTTCSADRTFVTQATQPGRAGIAFVSQNDFDSRGDIFAMDANGQNQLNLTNTPSTSDTQPQWSPDAKQIAYVCGGDVCAMDADGRNPLDLANTHASVESQLAWSPSGRQIAFTATEAGNTDVYVVDADGTHQSRLTTAPAEDLDPTWSPDGTQIALASLRDGNSEIYKMDATGGNQVNLTKRAGDDIAPAWSPDGHRIAFSSPTYSGGLGGIWTMNPDGSNMTKLTDGGSFGGDQNPVWSPDSTKIAFISPGPLVNTETLVINADGSNLAHVAEPFALHPTWAPDSKKLAYGSGLANGRQIYTSNADGTNDTPLTSSPEGADRPDWSPLSATGSS